MIHNNDSLAGIQLFYGGLIPGLGATVPLKPGKGWIPGTVAWGPTNKYPIGNPKSRRRLDRGLSTNWSKPMRRRRAARKEAGFDFLSFHFCHGSLPHVNLSLLVQPGPHRRIRRPLPVLRGDPQAHAGAVRQGLPDHSAPVLRREPATAATTSTISSNTTRRACMRSASLCSTAPSARCSCAPSRRADIHSTEFIGPSSIAPRSSTARTSRSCAGGSWQRASTCR